MVRKIILASNSPRRKELLAGLGLPFEVHVLEGIDESYPHDLLVSEVALYIARKKAAAYRQMIVDDELVITADTVVIVGDEILGKPVDEADAVRMLRLLSGKTHQVTTGVCLLTAAQERRMSPSSRSAMRRSAITSPVTSLSTRLVPMASRSGSAISVSPVFMAVITM